jgi:RNA polymerase sigma factor for flagellar operon FliA
MHTQTAPQAAIADELWTLQTDAPVSRRAGTTRSIAPRSIAPRSMRPSMVARSKARGATVRPPRAPVASRAATRRTPASPQAQELLARFTPIVHQIASGFQRRLPRSVLRDDLIAAGMGGLWDAIVRHGENPDEGFEWYVRVRVRGAILDELRSQDWLPRRVRARLDSESGEPVAVVRFDDLGEGERARCLATAAFGTEAAVEQRAMARHLAGALERLPERERHILCEHYLRGVKFKDLGAELGVSEPRISQLHTRALGRLREMMAEAA